MSFVRAAMTAEEMIMVITTLRASGSNDTGNLG
jgi:hypothetical protein